MPASFTDFVSVRSRPRADFELQVGASDPAGRADVINRSALGLLANFKKLVNTILDGGTFDFTDQDTVAAIVGLGITPQAQSGAGAPAAHTLYRQNVPKAWAQVAITPGLNESFNVTSVADAGTGLVTVTWDRDFANTSYSVVATVLGATRYMVTTSSNVAGSIRVDIAFHDGVLTDQAFCLIAMGTQ